MKPQKLYEIKDLNHARSILLMPFSRLPKRRAALAFAVAHGGFDRRTNRRIKAAERDRLFTIGSDCPDCGGIIGNDGGGRCTCDNI